MAKASFNYPRPALAVDIVILCLRNGQLQVLLLKRKNEPFQDSWALPGGFVRVDAEGCGGEDLQVAAERRLCEETRLPPGSIYLEQLYTFGSPERDPRTRVVSVAYYALLPEGLADLAEVGERALEVGWFPLQQALNQPLAFDHLKMLQMTLRRLQGKLNYSPVALEFLPKYFTIAELRTIHQLILGEQLDPGNFRRKFLKWVEAGYLAVGEGTRTTGKKPAQTYQRGLKEWIY